MKAIIGFLSGLLIYALRYIKIIFVNIIAFQLFCRFFYNLMAKKKFDEYYLFTSKKYRSLKYDSKI